MQNKEVSSKHYALFTQFLQKNSGIVLGDTKQYLVRSRLISVMFANNIDDINQLIDAIIQNASSPLAQQAIDAMTTNETLWFRDAYPFELLKTEIFPAMATNKKTLNIWSAACSSGQEPYSICMVYKEYLQHNPLKQFLLNVTATDISTQMLKKCRAGEYDELSLSRGGLTPERRQRYFTKLDEQTLKISQDVSKHVQFKPHNLMSDPCPSAKFDIIFCRNVLIYFSAQMKTKILQQFAACLSPGGILFLGASESIGDVSSLFTMVRCSSGLYYKLK